MGKLTETHWRAAIWDKPKNGTRYCVKRPDASAYAGWDYKKDGRGGVITYASRVEAERAALKEAEG